MNSEVIARSIYLSLWLVLVASSLALRRLPRGRIISLGGVWLAIILSLWALITLVQKLL